MGAIDHLIDIEINSAFIVRESCRSLLTFKMKGCVRFKIDSCKRAYFKSRKRLGRTSAPELGKMRSLFSRLRDEGAVSGNNSVRRTKSLYKLFVKIEKIKFFLKMTPICFFGEAAMSGHCKKIDTARQSDEESENVNQDVSPDGLEFPYTAQNIFDYSIHCSACSVRVDKKLPNKIRTIVINR
ncbi:MAG: hypothetical protein D3916_15350 [Candidatus Electrothrix sp. MAN1_4]|nr:hypothetical protein [Candidatus Electrothrix sp. MAN1_4]